MAVLNKLTDTTATEEALPVKKVGAWIGREYGIPAPSLETVYRWMLRGSHGASPLASFRIGGRRYVRPADLREFLADLNK